MFKRLISAGLVFGMAAMGPPATAQGYCGPRAAIVDQLVLGFGERPLVQGLRPPAELFEFWAAPEGGTWTLIVSRADGLACVLAAGTAWAPAPAQPAAEASRG